MSKDSITEKDFDIFAKKLLNKKYKPPVSFVNKKTFDLLVKHKIIDKKNNSIYYWNGF